MGGVDQPPLLDLWSVRRDKYLYLFPLPSLCPILCSRPATLSALAIHLTSILVSDQTAILCHSAKTLGEYILESEWDLILNLIGAGDFPSCDSEEEFIEKIKGYTYYHALVCSCGGDLEEVNSQLEKDYEEVEKSIKK